MSDYSNFQALLEVALDVDEAAVERGDEAIIGDREIRLLLRENRIALAKGKTTSLHRPKGGDQSLAYYDVPLVCLVHSHPECRFHWSRLMVDLSPTSGAQIRDMVPREVRGDKPVVLKTTVGVDLKYEIVPKVLSGEMKAEHTTSRMLYYPEIVSGGAGFTKGYWDFLALTGDYMHADRELRLLVTAPVLVPVQARFGLSAKVKFQGAAGLIPLLARSGEINRIHRLN